MNGHELIKVMSQVGLRYRLTMRDTRNLIPRCETAMRPRRCAPFLPTPRTRLPTGGLENATEVHSKHDRPLRGLRGAGVA